MNINATLIAQLIVFLLLVWFCMAFVWPPIVKALDERAGKIAEGLAAAERGKSDFEQAEKRVAELLAQGRKDSQELVSNADKRATEIVEEAKIKAQEKQAEILAKGQSEVDVVMNQAREQLREEVARLAVKGAEQILRREIDASKHADILDALKQEL